ncbi:MAG: WD40 repeat domain-containing protein [bacterium]
MDNKLEQNKSAHIQRIQEINLSLSRIQKDILNSSESDELTHTIIRELPQRVCGIATSDIDSHFCVNYNNGSSLRSYDIKTGACTYQQNWQSDTNHQFQGSSFHAPFYMATSKESGMLRVFSLNDKKSMIAVTNSRHIVHDAILTPDGLISTCNDDGRCSIYTTSDWRFIRTLHWKDETPALSIALVPKSHFILIGHSDGVVDKFDYITGENIFSIKVSDQPIISLSSSQTYFCAASKYELFLINLYGKIIRIFNTGRPVTQVKISYGDCWTHTPRLLRSRAFNPKFLFELIFVGMESGDIQVYENFQTEYTFIIEGHKKAVTSLLIHPDGRIFSGSEDGTVRQFDYNSKRCTKVYYEFDGNRSAAFSSDSKYLCVSGIMDDNAKLIDLQTGLVRYEFQHQNSVRSVAFAKVNNKEYVFSAGWDGRIKQWDIQTGDLICEFEVNGKICDLKISGDYLLAGFYIIGKSGGFYAFDLPTRMLLYICEDHQCVDPPGQTVAIVPYRKFIYSAADDGMIFKYDLGNNIAINSFNHGDSIRCLAITNDGKRLFSASTDYTTKIWNTSSGKLEGVLKGHRMYIYSVVLTLDNKFIFSADNNGVINKFNLSTGEIIRNYHSPSLKRIWMLKITNDGRTLLSCSEDSTVGFYDTETLELLGSYYNLSGSFLWTTEPVKDTFKTYYWTDRLDRIKVFEKISGLSSDENTIDEKRINEYHAVYNNQKIVMSRLNRNNFYDILKTATEMINQKVQYDKLINGSNLKLIS